MTQALNLANFANTLNTSGQASNSGLQNSSLTVTAGTGMSGGGSVSLGSSVTLTNAGVTSLTAGSGISVSSSTGSITISSSAPSLGAIGDVIWASNNTTSNYKTGDTIAGSNLYYINTLTAINDNQMASNGTAINAIPSTTWNWTYNYVFRTATGSGGYQAPLGASTLTGTWRCLVFSQGYISNYFPCCGGYTRSQSYATLWIRIS